MTPLGFSGLETTLTVVWAVAFMVAAIEVGLVNSLNRLPDHSVLFAASRFICFGCMFTVFAIAQRAHDFGLITRGLYLFTLLMAALAVLAAGASAVRAKT
jgi:hypothetical protein